MTPPSSHSQNLHASRNHRYRAFYCRVINITMLMALGNISSKKPKGTHATAQAITQLLNYSSAHPDATIRYHASDMCLHIHSDASYLSEANARIHTGGTFSLIAKSADPAKHPSVDAPPPPYNGAIHTISAITANAMASATEAEFGVSHRNGTATTGNPNSNRQRLRRRHLQ
jgi:hypothetical protein